MIKFLLVLWFNITDRETHTGHTGTNMNQSHFWTTGSEEWTFSTDVQIVCNILFLEISFFQFGCMEADWTTTESYSQRKGR